MPKAKWHIVQDGDALTLARHLPARFDVMAETIVANGAPKRLAHQVRQDMWRALQNLRGFSPVVQVTRLAEGHLIRAGGAVAGRFNKAKTEAVIADLLADPVLRARWMRFATRAEGAYA